MKNFSTYIGNILRDIEDPNTKKDMEEEMMSHLDSLKQEYLAKGYPEQDAVKLAMHDFGETHTLRTELKKSLSPCSKIITVSSWILFAIYSLTLLFNLVNYRLLLMRPFSLEIFMRSSNFVPFKTIIQYFINPDNLSFDIRVTNTVGILIAFIPFGFLLPILFKKIKTVKTIVGLTLLTSLSIEIFQVTLGGGSFDVDDILLETVGSTVGYIAITLLLKGFHKIKSKWFVAN